MSAFTRIEKLTAGVARMVTLARRVSGSPNIEVLVPAVVIMRPRNYGRSGELTGADTTTMPTVIIAGEALRKTTFPGDPKEGDLVKTGGTTYRVKVPNPQYIGETVAMYRMGVEGG